MQNLIIVLSAITATSCAALVAVGILWMRRWRQNIMQAIAEATHQNTHTAQRLGETLVQMQKQQQSHDDRLQTLTQSNVQLRQGLVNVATRLDHSQTDGTRSDHTVH